jgi:perosamine synthetase
MGCFSFSAPKIITTGQGGAVVTNDEGTAIRLRALKNFGRLEGGHDLHDTIGYNFKFTDLQAVVGLEQLKKLPRHVERKKTVWEWYFERLSGQEGVEMLETDTTLVAPWFMDVFVQDPDGLQAYLRQQGIGSRRIYPPIHSQMAYGGSRGAFPITESYADRGLWLPSSVDLSESDVERVCAAIRAFCQTPQRTGTQ